MKTTPLLFVTLFIFIQLGESQTFPGFCPGSSVNIGTPSNAFECAPHQIERNCTLTEILAHYSPTKTCLCPGVGKRSFFELVITSDTIPIILPERTGTRLVLRGNGIIPGPTINVTQYDWVVIRVINKMHLPTTIHWHGQIQSGTQYSDGVHSLTQCSVPSGSSVDYQFRASLSGTFWWHSHQGLQYIDGLVGAFVVNRNYGDSRTEAQVYGYSQDDVLVIQDLYNQYSQEISSIYYLTPGSGGSEPPPDAIIVNGKLSTNTSGVLSDYLFRLHVDRNSTTRLRFVAANALLMYNISIDGVKMTIIETDGTTTVPIAYPWFILNAGQRVSLLVDWSSAPLDVDGVYIRVSFNNDPTHPWEDPDYPLQNFVGVVEFKENLIPYPPAKILPSPSFDPPSPLDSNQLQAVPLYTRSPIPNPTHLLYTEIIMPKQTTDWNNAEGKTLKANVTYASFEGVPSMPNMQPSTLFDYYTGSLPDWIAFNIPSTKNFDQNLYPNFPYLSDLYPIYYNPHMQYCLPYLAVVEHVINNTDNGDHPIHKHTTPFWIVSSIEWPEAIHRSNYPIKDVVTVPANGWVILRYLIDVPGIWALHCHIDWHLQAGLFGTLVAAPELLYKNYASWANVSDDFKTLCGLMHDKKSLLNIGTVQ